MIDQIIDYNKTFVEQKGYEKYLTSKYPLVPMDIVVRGFLSTLKLANWKK